MSNLGRRLDRLENAETGMSIDIAAILEAARRSARSLTFSEQATARSVRLKAMLEQHTTKPFRGLALLILEGLQRVCMWGTA